MFTNILTIIRTQTISIVFAVVLAGISFSLLAPAASAQVGNSGVTAELQAQIAALMAQIASLQASQTPTAIPPSSNIEKFIEIKNISATASLNTTSAGAKGGSIDGIFEIEITAIDSPLFINPNSINVIPIVNERFATSGNLVLTKSVSSQAPIVGNYFMIDEGETRVLKIKYQYSPKVSGVYVIVLQNIGYSLSQNGKTITKELYPNRPETAAITYSSEGSVAPDASKTITLTAPNGGEKWEMGVTNTVTWKPYGYNPDVNPAKDVTAYLEIKNADGSFKTLGKVQESGKASIHWPTGELNSLTAGGNYAPAGSGYYIRIVNNVTGATDRSDRPFTLLAKPVDLKVNGSDGPVKVSLNEKVTLSWNALTMARCEIHNAYKDTSRNTEIGNVALAGQMVAYLHSDPLWGPSIYCYKKDGNSVYDSVKRTPVKAVTPSNIQVLSPNGGEILNATKPVNVNFVTQGGISAISVALYKNEMWKAWIVKDLNIQTREKVLVDFTPNKIIQGLGEGDNKGDVFKIYITGKKADGSGYVDDKSDQAFQFVNGVMPVGGVAPKKNIFGCDRSVTTKVASGSIACYGMWDYGEDFGGDVKMCGSYDGKIGCVIQTPVCSSGSAKASKYINNSSLTSSTLGTISSRLGVSEGVAKSGIAGLWEYTCVGASEPLTTTSSCLSGTVKYSEGTKLQEITVNGLTTVIADASYVCRSGVWKIEGSLPVKPIDPKIVTTYGPTEIQSITFKDLVTQSSMTTFGSISSNWGTRTERTYTVTLKTEKVILVREILNAGGTSLDPIKASGFTGTSAEFRVLATRTPEVKGASIDLLSDISVTLNNISRIVADIK